MIELLITSVSSLLDKFIPDADEKARLAHEIATLAERQVHEIAQAQIQVNKEEAQSKSIFVSGWRPAAGWSCVLGLSFNFVISPLGNFALAVSGSDVVLPTLDLSTMMPVLLGMLGLGGLRSYERTRNVARGQ